MPKLFLIHPIIMILMLILWMMSGDIISTSTSTSTSQLVLNYFVFTVPNMALVVLLYGWPIHMIKQLSLRFCYDSVWKMKILAGCFTFQLLFVVVMPILLYLGYANDQDTGVLFRAIPLLSFVGAGYYIILMASKTLVYSEKEANVSSNGVVGTFFCFLYLPLFLYFINRRLRVLGEL